MTAPKLITFGCRLNAYESQIISANAQSAGLENSVIINTCAVTSEAQRQARQAIRRAARENPGARIIVTGCAAQISAGEFAAMDEVDLVLGNEEKLKASSYAAAAFGLEGEEKVRVNDIMSVKETAPQMIDGFGERARAFVQIQTGCDHRCTFCIIPYGRGNSRSVPVGSIVRQIKALVEKGYREVVLTGVDITSYGADLPGRPVLGSLVARILKLVPGLMRLRLSSIDSVEADSELIAVIAGEERLMPHLHLSLQAGDDMILKRMKRRHLRAQSVEFCDQMKQARPGIVFGADLIAGFPTETDAMFENTLALVDECDLTWLHVFPYSPRPGTPAARMPQVDGNVIRERAARLRAAGQRRLSDFLAGQTGATITGLVETPVLARSGQYAPVRLEHESRPGEIIDIHVTGTGPDYLKGRLAA